MLHTQCLRMGICGEQARLNKLGKYPISYCNYYDFNGARGGS